MKNKIKSIPFFGWLIRWGYNLLRLNYIKHTLFMQQQFIKELKEQNRLQAKEIEHLKIQIEQLKKLYSSIDTKIDSSVARKSVYHLDTLSQRLEQFIFDEK